MNTSKKETRKERNKRVEEIRMAAADAKRERKQASRVKVQGLSDAIQEKLDAERKRLDEEKSKREAELNALPPKRFYFTVVTSIPGRAYEDEKSKLFGLTQEEQDEYIKLKWIDRMNSRPIRSCELVEWGDYKED